MLRITRAALAACRIVLHSRVRRHRVDVSTPPFAYCLNCGRYWWGL